MSERNEAIITFFNEFLARYNCIFEKYSGSFINDGVTYGTRFIKSYKENGYAVGVYISVTFYSDFLVLEGEINRREFDLNNPKSLDGARDFLEELVLVEIEGYIKHKFDNLCLYFSLKHENFVMDGREIRFKIEPKESK